MTQIHNLGFPRIGLKRELKFACEAYWRGEIDLDALQQTGRELRQQNWQLQLTAGLDLLPVGDFSFYDQMLDTSFLLGNIPPRFDAQYSPENPPDLDVYFRVARGRSRTNQKEQGTSSANPCCAAAEMTKWFDTNYHYLVPEFDSSTRFFLNPAKLLGEIKEAQSLTSKIKPVVIGPLSYLWLGKMRNKEAANTEEDKFALLDQLVPHYRQLLNTLAEEGIEWVQIDEPILALDLPQNWLQAFEQTYHQLQVRPIKILLATYFGPLQQNLATTLRLPVAGIHLDTVRGSGEVQSALDLLPAHKVLSLGVIDGRNIWKSDLNQILDWLRPLSESLGERLWLAPSCSLLHVPVDLALETKLDPEIKNWLAFAKQKLTELAVLKQALLEPAKAATTLQLNAQALAERRSSSRVKDPAVQTRLASVTAHWSQRISAYPSRSQVQKPHYRLPLFPTTTIGSFPQTKEIRQARRSFKNGTLSSAAYLNLIKNEIKYAIRAQEDLGLDVLVHGEAERNDMVEYFGEQLHGYTFTDFGWVQSYGSRCVKPPIIFGDVSRPAPMTVDWTSYAQSLTDKPVKGMLTGPITMLQWSFVRDDQPRRETAQQIAMALRDEVTDLENAGITIIQVDEPALREGLPLRHVDWDNYLKWAVQAFKISTCSVADTTQIHTHMCYAEFNDIIQAIAGLDADVITIETSRSRLELLDAFFNFDYPNEIGPGVYDIHSPNIPTVQPIVDMLSQTTQYLTAERLWINPDCGLKTRTWDEVKPALANMVAAAVTLRVKFSAP